MQNNSRMLSFLRASSAIVVVCTMAVGATDTLWARDTKGCPQCQEQSTIDIKSNKSSENQGDIDTDKDNISVEELVVDFTYETQDEIKKRDKKSDDIGKISNEKDIKDDDNETELQNDDLTAHFNHINKAESNIGSLGKKYEDHNDMLKEFGGRIDKNDDGLISVFESNKILNGAVAAHDKVIDSHEMRLGANERSIANNEQMINELVENGASRDEIITDHGQSIGKLDEAMVDANIRGDRHDRSLVDHERRITGSEGAIHDIQEGAVHYDRDSNGNKSGGLTLRGAGKAPVRLSNIAPGGDGKDAANVDQLSDAVKYLGGGAAVRLDGSISGPAYTIAGKTYDNVSAALRASDRLGVRYVGDENGNPTNTIVLSGDGTGKPVSLANVAPARRSTDAPNYAQVLQLRQASFDYTDQRIGELETSTSRQFAALSGDISKSRQEARGGIASALAAAGLRFDDRPGKGSIATSFGNFKGATAVAAGLGYTTESGDWRLNAAVAHSFTTNDTSWNVAASWTFD